MKTTQRCCALESHVKAGITRQRRRKEWRHTVEVDEMEQQLALRLRSAGYSNDVILEIN